MKQANEVEALKRLGWSEERRSEPWLALGNAALETLVRIETTDENSAQLERLTGWTAEQLREDYPSGEGLGSRAIIAFDFDRPDGFAQLAWMDETDRGTYSLRLRDDSEPGDLPYSYEAGEFGPVFHQLSERMWRIEYEGCDECGKTHSDGGCSCKHGCLGPLAPRRVELSEVFQGLALMSAMVLALTLS